MRKVLIVDDEIMVRIGMKAIIDWESYGWTVTGDCSSAEEALKKIAEDEPDLIMTDLRMDGMDGFGLMKLCSEKYPDIRFIILSNYNDFDNTKKAIQLGAIDYIFKLTITPADMADTLKRAESHFVTRASAGRSSNKAAEKAYLLRAAEEGNYRDEVSFLRDFRKACPAADLEKRYCAMQISIDASCGSAAGNTEIQPRIPKYEIENMLSEVMNQNETAEVISFGVQDFIILFNVDEKADRDAVCAYAGRKFDIIREYLKRYYSLDSTGALSSVYSGLTGIRKAVSETNRILIYRIPSECGRLHIGGETQRTEITEAKRYIREHLKEDIALDTMAQQVNMSPSYFSHIFKEEMKISFTDYVNRMKIQRACELLKDPRLKVNEVAIRVGIENFNYFSVLFKKINGVSPNAYREKLQKTE